MIPPDPAAERSPADNLALVQRIADGDPLALSALYDRHAPAVYSHALHLLGDVAEAEDAVEETFWRVWGRAAEYDPTFPSVPTWLLMICRQRAAERLRSKRRALDQLLADTTGLGSPGTRSEATADAGGVASALAALPSDQRMVLELAFFRGIAPADVARLTKQSPETARTRLRVAIRKLRDALGETPRRAATGEAEVTP